ncbi:MAG: IS30 family transposase [Oscillospiraceae bacterium]|nr:IS30 family transposase [Oscillospiraceae bacterium]
MSNPNLDSYKGLFRNLAADLWETSRRKQRKKTADKRVPHPKWPTSSDRPAPAACRSGFGHWEMDLVVDCRDSSSALLTRTERMTRREIIFKLPNRKAATIRKQFDKSERRMGKQFFCDVFKTVTTDNGSEFLQCDELRRLIFGGVRFDVYYCHSYCFDVSRKNSAKF